MQIKNKTTYKKPIIGLSVYNKDMTKIFHEYGIVPNKSQSAKFPKNINSKNIWPFLRGYFDGDGYTTKGSFILCVSKSFGEKLQQLLKDWYDIKSYVHPHANGNIHMFYVHKKEDRLKIFQNLYKNKQNMFLIRKYEKFKQYLNL